MNTGGILVPQRLVPSYSQSLRLGLNAPGKRPPNQILCSVVLIRILKSVNGVAVIDGAAVDGGTWIIQLVGCEELVVHEDQG